MRSRSLASRQRRHMSAAGDGEALKTPRRRWWEEERRDDGAAVDDFLYLMGYFRGYFLCLSFLQRFFNNFPIKFQ